MSADEHFPRTFKSWRTEYKACLGQPSSRFGITVRVLTPPHQCHRVRRSNLSNMMPFFRCRDVCSLPNLQAVRISISRPRLICFNLQPSPSPPNTTVIGLGPSLKWPLAASGHCTNNNELPSPHTRFCFSLKIKYNSNSLGYPARHTKS